MDYNTVEEKPERITPQQVCYWYEREGKLVGDQKSKAKKFLENGCVLETGNRDLFVVKFLEGYNKTNHQVNMAARSCSCQHYRKYQTDCSHIKAVDLYIFMRAYNGRNNQAS